MNELVGVGDLLRVLLAISEKYDFSKLRIRTICYASLSDKPKDCSVIDPNTIEWILIQIQNGNVCF